MKNYNEKFKIFKKFKQDILLRNHTTFKIGGSAKYFVEAKSKQDIIEAVKWAKQNSLPFFILGGGSNLLVSDDGFNGLVIKCQMSNVKCQNQMSDVKTIYAEGGAKLEGLVKLSAKQGLTGLEWAAGIPQATVGGAVKVNASAFGKSMKKIVKHAEVFEGIILSVELALKKGDKKEIQKQINYVLNYRKQNHPMHFHSAGCIFKNPSKAPAAKLIDQCHLKGKTIGPAQISQKHANFIINLGAAKASDVRQLINLAKQEVKNKFNIELQEEIQYLGF